MSYGPQTRASDDDREKIAGRLRDAHAEGRLSLEEFHTRLDAAYGARTYGELEPLVRDIPIMRVTPDTAAVVPSTPAATVGRRTGGEKAMAVLWTIWSAIVAVNLVVWLLVSVTNAQFTYFWPAWVAGPSGAVLCAVELARRRL